MTPGALTPTTLLREYRELFAKVQSLDTSFASNSPPAVFVGRFGYPHLNVGVLTPPQRAADAWLYDAEAYWAQHGFSISQILQLRGSLINSRFKAPVKSARTSERFLALSQEIAMAAKPVDVEIELQKKVRVQFDVDQILKPMGPRGSSGMEFLLSVMPTLSNVASASFPAIPHDFTQSMSMR